MSHYAKLAVNFKQSHEKELVDSLIKVFGQVEVHDKPQDLELYTGKSATENQENHADPCNIIVRRKALAKRLERPEGYMPFNDLGYRRNSAGGYDVFIDAAGVKKADIGVIAQDYALRVAQKQLQQNGYTVRRQLELPDGSIRLEMAAFR
jgi:hypothetical protein